MESYNKHKIKKNGIYYTPPNLANLLVKPLIKRPDLSIFDPAFGEGALLFAAKERCDEIGSFSRKKPTFSGCDKIASNGKFKKLGNSRFFYCDFLTLNCSEKSDLILMNPPYVRHHRINNEDREEYQKEINNTCRLKKSTDLWGYFLAKSINHLKEGGSIGAILPWSFLQADYAREIRILLSRKFAEIQVLALSKEYFEKAEERILLLWLKGYGKKIKSIKISFSESSDKKVKYSEIDKHQWEESTVVFSSKFNIRGILQRYIDEFGFSNLRKYADVRIGVVTGADKFFILNQNTAVNYGFKNNNLVPIICKSNEFKGLLLNGYKPETMLIKFPSVCSNQLNEYKKEGEEKEYHLRAHSKLRNPWFDINSGEVPDAFFPYRVSITPYLVFNNSKIQCTNSVHRVYFKGLTENAKKWVQVSLLSNAGQLALEAYSKTYGSGVLKIEPGSLQNAIIHKGNKKIPDKVYAEIARSIENNDRKNAVKLASQFINETLNIPESLSKKTTSALNELQSRRKCRAKKKKSSLTEESKCGQK